MFQTLRVATKIVIGLKNWHITRASTACTFAFLTNIQTLFRCQIQFILKLVYVIICISQILFLTMITSLFANVMHNTYTVVSFLCFIELGEEIQNG